MPYRNPNPLISYRDVTFKDLVGQVEITVITDVPCHLWCRTTLEPPDIHAETVKRRGVIFNTELRFCFVAYEDEEQLEPGDVTTHHFLKPNWPYCTTKYVYFWGYVGGVLSKSSSPIFQHHNTLVPIPHYTVGDVPINYGSATPQNQAVLAFDAPASGPGNFIYLSLYASPYPMDTWFYVAAMRRVGVNLYNCRGFVKVQCSTYGISRYVVSLFFGAGDYIAAWGSYAAIRSQFSLTEGKASDYYYSNPFTVGQNLAFDNSLKSVCTLITTAFPNGRKAVKVMPNMFIIIFTVACITGITIVSMYELSNTSIVTACVAAIVAVAGYGFHLANKAATTTNPVIK